MNKAVLVIEDNEQSLYLVRFMLEKNGFIEKAINPTTVLTKSGVVYVAESPDPRQQR